MKKLLLTTLLAVLAAASTLANDNRINSVAMENFKRDFKNVSQVQWQAYGDYAFALFNQDGEIVKAYYNESGELYGTSRTVNVKDLPVAVKRGFASTYANYAITEAIKFDGLEESAYFITAKKDGEVVVLKSTGGVLSVSRRVRG